MHAEAERQVAAHVRPVDDVAIRVLDRLLVEIAGQVPHRDLVPPADALAAHVHVGDRGAAHVRQRRLPADRLGHHARNEFLPVAQLVEFVGVLVQGQHARRHRVARRVVAADDQQQDVAVEFRALHAARAVGMREHGNQVGLRRLLQALLQQPREIGKARLQRLAARSVRFERRDDRNIGPLRQQAAVLVGKAEQRRQHLGREIDRDLRHPVEFRAHRQSVEHVGRALADQDFEIAQIRLRDDRTDRPALLVVARRVHGDEIAPRAILERNPAVFRIRGKHRVVGVDLHDVVEPGDRPIGPPARFRAIMHGVLAPQAREIRADPVLAKQRGIADVDLVERNRMRIGRGDDGVHLSSGFLVARIVGAILATG